MKTAVKNTLLVLLFTLVAINVYIFVAGMYLSDDINRFDLEIKKLTRENLMLERQVYEAQSLQYAASLSAKLDFTKKSQPIFFESLKYAFVR